MYDRPSAPPADLAARWELSLDDVDEPGDLGTMLLGLIGTPELGSRRRLWERYDHTVRLGTVVGPGGDAAVVRLGRSNKGVAISVECESRLVWLDPRRGAAHAVAVLNPGD